MICGDILDHARPGGYDVVAANFFLNVFAEPVMAEVLRHLARQLRPGGRLLIADFAPAAGAPLPRALRWLYFGCAVLAFRVLAGNALHPMYDYPAQFPGAGLLPGESRGFRLLGRGPVVFRTLTGVRVG